MRYLKRFTYFFHLLLLIANIILISDDYIPDNSIKQGKFQQQDKRELTSLNLYRGDLHGEIEVEIEDGHDGFGGSEYLLDEDYEVNYCILFLFYKVTMNVMQSIGGAMITGPTSSSSSSLIVRPIL